MKSLLLLICVTAFAIAIEAKVIENEKWVWIPTEDGDRTKVSLTEVEEQVQPFFLATDEVSFELFTLKNPYNAQIISPSDLTSINESNLNPDVPTRITIHGWQERGDYRKRFLEGYFAKGQKDINLIYVNWEASSQTINYIAARNRVEEIGKYVAEMIDFLVQNTKVKLNDINVIGFSLGAHIAGHTGKNVRSGQLPKITGLDPAGPLFSPDKPNERLDKLDAKYVEIIHTNGKFLGLYDPIGTVSFYPNRGWVQNGCTWDPTGTCSHLRAYRYFTESIYSTISFYGYPCESFNDMKNGKCGGVGVRMGGEPGNYEAPASIYYLETNPKAIFARGGSRDM